MNNSVKKFFSSAFLVMFGVSALSPVCCCSGSKKASEVKKPFKNVVDSKVVQEALTYELMPHNYENSAMTMRKLYEDFLSYDKMFACGTFWVKLGYKLSSSRIEALSRDFNRIVFESGSIGTRMLNNFWNNLLIEPNKEEWKIVIYPILSEYGIPIDNSFELVIFNPSNGCERVFYFLFGNTCTLGNLKDYDYMGEIRRYNKFIDIAMKFNPENPFGLQLKKVNFFDIKYAEVPQRAENIKNGSFFYFKNLEIVDVLGFIDSIGENSFGKCTNLKKINFHNTVISVEKAAFKECYKLKELYFPAGLKFIGHQAFDDCCSLEKITIPLSTEILYESAFNNTPDNLKIIYGEGEYSKNDFFDAFFANGGLVINDKLSKIGN